MIAASETAARGLLASLIGPVADRPAPRVHIVTLVLDAPELDAAPRGSGVLTVPGSHAAKALTHATAKWPWLRRRRCSRRRTGTSCASRSAPSPSRPRQTDLDRDAATALALAEASALLGVTLDAGQLVGERHRTL